MVLKGECDRSNKVFFATRSFDGYNFSQLSDDKENEGLNSAAVQGLVVKGIVRKDSGRVEIRAGIADSLSSPTPLSVNQKTKIGKLCLVNGLFHPFPHVKQGFHGQEKISGNEVFARSGESQGILWMAREI